MSTLKVFADVISAAGTSAAASVSCVRVKTENKIDVVAQSKKILEGESQNKTSPNVKYELSNIIIFSVYYVVGTTCRRKNSDSSLRRAMIDGMVLNLLTILLVK